MGLIEREVLSLYACACVCIYMCVYVHTYMNICIYVYILGAGVLWIIQNR